MAEHATGRRERDPSRLRRRGPADAAAEHERVHLRTRPDADKDAALVARLCAADIARFGYRFDPRG